MNRNSSPRRSRLPHQHQNRNHREKHQPKHLEIVDKRQHCRLPLDGVVNHAVRLRAGVRRRDRKSTRLNSSHSQISYAVFCLKKKKKKKKNNSTKKTVKTRKLE